MLQRRWHCLEPRSRHAAKGLGCRKGVSQGPHIHPSLNATRARIRASEEPLGQSCWASGTLWVNVEEWRARGSKGKAGGLRMLHTLPLICLGSRHSWTVPKRE